MPFFSKMNPSSLDYSDISSSLASNSNNQANNTPSANISKAANDQATNQFRLPLNVYQTNRKLKKAQQLTTSELNQLNNIKDFISTLNDHNKLDQDTILALPALARLQEQGWLNNTIKQACMNYDFFIGNKAETTLVDTLSTISQQARANNQAMGDYDQALKSLVSVFSEDNNTNNQLMLCTLIQQLCKTNSLNQGTMQAITKKRNAAEQHKVMFKACQSIEFLLKSTDNPVDQANITNQYLTLMNNEEDPKTLHKTLDFAKKLAKNQLLDEANFNALLQNSTQPLRQHEILDLCLKTPNWHQQLLEQLIENAQSTNAYTNMKHLLQGQIQNHSYQAGTLSNNAHAMTHTNSQLGIHHTSNELEPTNTQHFSMNLS